VKTPSTTVVAGACPSHWDRDVEKLAGANPFQTAGWAAYTRRYLRSEPYFIAVDSAGEPRIRIVIERRAWRHTDWFERPAGPLLIAALKRVRPVLLWLRGPVCAPDIADHEASEFVAALLELARRLRARLSGNLPIYGRGLPGPALTAALRARNILAANEATFLVDVARPEEVLRRSIRPAARKAIRAAAAAGVLVRPILDGSEVQTFHRILVESRRRDGLRTFSAANLETLWDELAPRHQMTLFLAEQEGQPVGGLGVWHFDHVAVEFAAARSDRARRERVYSGDALKWEAFLWAGRAGIRWFDLAGVSPDAAPGTKERGIYQFKEKWGGMLVRTPTVEWPRP